MGTDSVQMHYNSFLSFGIMRVVSELGVHGFPTKLQLDEFNITKIHRTKKTKTI